MHIPVNTILACTVWAKPCSALPPTAFSICNKQFTSRPALSEASRGEVRWNVRQLQERLKRRLVANKDRFKKKWMIEGKIVWGLQTHYCVRHCYHNTLPLRHPTLSSQNKLDISRRSFTDSAAQRYACCYLLGEGWRDPVISHRRQQRGSQ